MKNTLAVFVLILLATNTFAQEKKKTKSYHSTGYVIGFAGVSMPVGMYRSTLINDDEPGYAKDGWCSGVEFAMPFGRSHFGIAAHYGHYQHAIDEPAFSADITRSVNDGYTYTIIADNYELNNFMVGFYATFPINQLSIDFKVMSGYSLFTFPKMVLSAGGGSATSKATTDGSVSYGGNVTARYGYKHFCFFLQAGAIGTDAPYWSTFNNYSTGASAPIQGVQPIALINIATGIGIQF